MIGETLAKLKLIFSSKSYITLRARQKQSIKAKYRYTFLVSNLDNDFLENKIKPVIFPAIPKIRISNFIIHFNRISRKYILN